MDLGPATQSSVCAGRKALHVPRPTQKLLERLSCQNDGTSYLTMAQQVALAKQSKYTYSALLTSPTRYLQCITYKPRYLQPHLLLLMI